MFTFFHCWFVHLIKLLLFNKTKELFMIIYRLGQLIGIQSIFHFPAITLCPRRLIVPHSPLKTMWSSKILDTHPPPPPLFPQVVKDDESLGDAKFFSGIWGGSQMSKVVFQCGGWPLLYMQWKAIRYVFVLTTEMFPFIPSLGNGEGNENTLKSRNSRKERDTTSYKVSSLGFSSKLAIWASKLKSELVFIGCLKIKTRLS